MKYIKELKIGKQIIGIEPKTIDKNGNEVWNIPQDLGEFKTLAIDTCNWKIGQIVKNAVGGKQVDLSASNSKAISLLAKVVNTLNPDINFLTDLEKSAFEKLNTLANAGYSDSNLLNTSLDTVLNTIPTYTDKIARITSVASHDHVIGILNG